MNNNLNAAAATGINIARIKPNAWSNIPAIICECERHYSLPAHYSRELCDIKLPSDKASSNQFASRQNMELWSL